MVAEAAQGGAWGQQQRRGQEGGCSGSGRCPRDCQSEERARQPQGAGGVGAGLGVGRQGRGLQAAPLS